MSNVQGKKSRLKRVRRSRAKFRVRHRVRGTEQRPRLAVFKSLKHIYAQVIDDDKGLTVAQASSLDPEVAGKLEGGTCNKASARLVGEVVGARAKSNGVEKVVFDRGGFVYHGKIKEVAEGARAQGLEF